MPLLDVTRDFLARVEEETGFPVKLTEEPGLPTLARIRPARGNVPAHFVHYKPTRDASLDYVICLQCGFVLRLFAQPPAQRGEFGGTAAGESTALRHVNGRIALGVALTRQRKYEDALPELERVVTDEPGNAWAHRNLGACLLHLKWPAEATAHLRTATELNPADERAWYGLGQALEATGDGTGADEAYKKVLALSELGDVAEQARRARSKMAGESFRSALPGLPRVDAVMYCLSALELFAKMTPDEVQKVGFEIGILGMSGLDTNDSTPKYRLRSLPGEFSGLHLVSLMYVAFQQIAPGHDVGFDLAREYELAVMLYERRAAPAVE